MESDHTRQELIPESAYRHEIDGLRAVSVIGVVLFHAGFGFPGGYVGVDVFFVISGFLITRQILTSLAAGKFSLLDFWERRVRRIFPPLVLMWLVVFSAGYVLLLPEDLVALSKSSVSQTLMAANVYAWRDTGYFAVAADLRPLLHMWSLAVEEQFYVLLPVLLLLFNRASSKVTRCLLILTFVTSLGLCILGTLRYPSAAFFLLPTRAWELLAGSLIATAGRVAWSPRLSEILSAVGLSSIFLSMMLFSNGTLFPGYAATIPVAGAASFILSNARGRTLAGRVLSLRLFVFFGQISYSLYLWHWPMLAYGRYVSDGEMTAGTRLVLVGCSIVAATVSLHLLETPFRRKFYLRKRGPLFGVAIGCSALMLLCGSFVWKNGGVASRVPLRLKVNSSKFARAEISEARLGHFPILGDTSKSAQPQFIVWGDSHAGMYNELFDKLGKQHLVAGLNAAHGGNPPLPNAQISWNGDLLEWNDLVLKEIESRRIRNIFLIGRWANYVEGSTKYEVSQGASFNAPLIFELNTDERTVEFSKRLFRDRVSAICERLTSLGCRVWIFQQVPELQFNPTRSAFVDFRTQSLLVPARRRTTMDEYLSRNEWVNNCLLQLACSEIQVFKAYQKVFGDSDVCRVEAEGNLLYRDHQHLSRFGAKFVAEDYLSSVFIEGLTEVSATTDDK